MTGQIPVLYKKSSIIHAYIVFYCSPLGPRAVSKWVNVYVGDNFMKHRNKNSRLCFQAGGRPGLPPYQVVSSSIQPFGHNRHGPKMGGTVPLLG